MKIAFDLDGTLCPIDIATLRLLDNVKDKEQYDSTEAWYYRERKPLLDARLVLSEQDEMYVITSRPERLRLITERWLKHYYPNAKLVIVNQNTLNVLKGKVNDKEAILNWSKSKAELKAVEINKLGIEVYFDDESEVMEYFRSLCPKCKIIKYGGRIGDGESRRN